MSTIDPFTVSVLLKALESGANTDNVADLYKMAMKSGPETPDAKEQQSLFDSLALSHPLGTRVKIHGTRVGTVVGYNRSTGGFYPGWRYPLILRFDAVCFKDNRSSTFEHSSDELTVIDLAEDAELIYTNFIDRLPSDVSASEVTKRLINMLLTYEHPNPSIIKAVTAYHHNFVS